MESCSKKVSDREAFGKPSTRIRLTYWPDHAPIHLRKRKILTQSPFGGHWCNTLSCTFDCCKARKTTWKSWLKKLSQSRHCLKFKNVVFFVKAFFADLVLVDLNQKFTVVKEDLLYQCRWSPFEGTHFGATIIKTFVNGNLVYDKGKIIESALGKN